MRRARVARAVAVVAALIGAACSSLTDLRGPTSVATPVATVQLAAPRPTVTEGRTLALTLTVLDAAGRALSGRTVAWSSSDTGVARVSTSGVVTGVRPGPVRIAASADGRSATIALTVAARTVAAVQVTPTPLALLAGQRQALSARTLDEEGQPLSGRAITWATNDATVAVVDAQGLVLAVAPGATAITATSEGRAATVPVTVAPVPVAAITVTPALDTIVVAQSTQLTATARDSTGAPLPDRVITWTSGTPAIATVSGTGAVLGVTPGTVTITATSGGRSGTARVLVQPRPVGAVIVSPSQLALTVGDEARLGVQVIDADGTLLVGRPVQFRSDAPAVATVAADGTVSGIGVGRAVITATSEGRTGTAIVTVAPSPVRDLRLAPVSLALRVGGTARVVATPLDENGTPLGARPVTWRTGAPTVFGVDASGLVTALAPGSGLVFATIEGRTASVPVTVSAAAVGSVVVTPTAANVFVGATFPLTAEVRDSAGAPLAGRVVTWTSTNPAVAVVASGGRVFGVAPGTTRVEASAEGASGGATITVLQVPVATVNIQLAASVILPGQSTQAAAIARDALGNVLTGRAVSWASANPAVATITPAGVITAIGIGSSTISAVVEGRTGTATLTVSPVPVASIAATLPDSSILVGQGVQGTAITRDSAGVVLPGRAIAWSSSATTIATVSTTGLVTGVAPGSATITATSEGRSTTIPLTVAPVPVARVDAAVPRTPIRVSETITATFVARDSAGGTLPGRTGSWSSSAPAVATVNATTGLVTAVAPGTTTLTATVEGQTGSVALAVTLRPVSTVAVTLADTARFVGQTTQATAVLRDSTGTVVTRPITWSSATPAVATVNPTTGLVTAVAPGRAAIIATSEGRTGSDTVTVRLVPVATVTATVPRTPIRVGETMTATAVARDSAGGILAGRTVTWSSGTPAVATISAAGLITALTPGTTVITATVEGRTGTVSVGVTLVPVQTVAVTLPRNPIRYTETLQATAVARDSAGGVLTGRAITWSSATTTIAAISTGGLITALSATGSSIITATVEGRSGTATVNVTPFPVTTVAVTLADTLRQAGQTTQATAVLRDSTNAIVTRPVTWSSSATAVATVSGTGLVTAVGPGRAAIIATSEGRTGNDSITVQAVPVATVDVTLPRPMVRVSETLQATAVTRDSTGAVLSGRAVTWASSAPAVATVNPTSGLITAVAPGSTTITGTSEGRSGTAALSVTVIPVATVTATTADTAVLIGGTTQATAVTRDSANRVLTGRTVTWSTAQPAVATVSGMGLVTGQSVGITTVIATSEGRTGSTPIRVLPVPVATVTVTLDPTSITVGQTSQATATLRDAGGNVLTGRLVVWTTSDSNIATVSQTGLVTAIAPGNAVITATSESRTGTATITVTP